MIQFVTDKEIYEKMIRDCVPQTQKRLWIATADIKDMYVEKAGLHRQMVPFLQILSELLERGVEIRLIHAKEPGPAFRQDFDRFPGLWSGMERDGAGIVSAGPFQMRDLRWSNRLFRQCKSDRCGHGGKERNSP